MDRNGDAARFGGFLVICGVLAAMADVIFAPPPRLPAAFVNGVYFNSRCGIITLSNGLASTKFGSFKYLVEKDKVSPYILPTDHSVVAYPTGLVVSLGKTSLFIRTDMQAKPQWIEIMGPQAEYRFTRR